MFDDGAEMPYDLFLGVPTHRVPEVVAQSGMTVDGWIPVNPMTLETRFPGVYAVGDVTSVGTPKAGVFAEGQAAIAADGISALIRGAGEPAHYDGRGVCYLEFGHNQVAKVDVTFVSGQPPTAGSKVHRPRSSPTRPTSVPVACSAGSGAPGPQSTLTRPDDRATRSNRALVFVSERSRVEPGISRQRQVQRRALACLIDGRFTRIAAVDSERDGGTDLASGNRVGTHHVDAESGEVVDTPGRGDSAQGLPDVGLHVGTGRQPSVACVEDLAGEPDDGSDTAGGRADREPQG